MTTTTLPSPHVETPEPGLYRHVHFANYLRWRILSNSTLKHGKESMNHLRAAIDGQRKVVPTDDMILGSALHVAFLEPEFMLDKVAAWDGDARRGTAWEKFAIENEHKYILTSKRMRDLQGMVQSLRSHPWVRSIMGKIDDTEMAAVGEVPCGGGGVLMKGRCDAITPEMLIDVKKVASGSKRKFTNAVLDFGYHAQGFIYKTLFQRERFVLLTVEDGPPYDVVPYELSPAMLRAGERQVIPLLDQYTASLAANHWPGRSDGIVNLELPEWADDEANGITLCGQSAFA